MPGIEDLFGAQAPQAQPVVGLPTAMNNLQNEQVVNQARQAQTATALQEAQNKQRQLQISMLNGVMALPEEQQHEALSRIVPMMNRMGPVKFDEGMTPQTAKLYMMSNVPTEQTPAFALNQQMANMAKVVQDRLAGGQTNQTPAAPAPGTPSTPMPEGGIINSPPSGNPMPANGQIPRAQPIPPGGGQAIDPQTLALMATLPGYDKAAQTINEIQNQSPEGQKNIERGKTEGKNLAENELSAHKADELTNRLEMNLNAMLDLNKATPSSGFIPADAQVWWNQGVNANFPNTEAGKEAGNSVTAANQWDQLNNQQIISEIQQFIASGGANVRTNQTLERIVRAASGIDKSAPPASREAQIKNALAEIQNKNVSAQNLAGANQPYQPIPVTTTQTKQPQSQNTPMPPQGAKRAPDGKWYLPDPNRPGKYLQWQP